MTSERHLALLIAVLLVATTATPTAGQQAPEVRFDNQFAIDTVLTASSTLPRGGFVVIHATAVSDLGAVRGHSQFLPPGTHENVSVQLDSPLDKGQILLAVLYSDDNGNGTFDTDTDEPYVRNRTLVLDPATVAVPVADVANVTLLTPQTPPSPEFIPVTVTRTVVRTRIQPVVQTRVRTVMRTIVETRIRTVDLTPTPGQPGFGIAIVVITLLAVTVLAIRRG